MIANLFLIYLSLSLKSDFFNIGIVYIRALVLGRGIGKARQLLCIRQIVTGT